MTTTGAPLSISGLTGQGYSFACRSAVMVCVAVAGPMWAAGASDTWADDLDDGAIFAAATGGVIAGSQSMADQSFDRLNSVFSREWGLSEFRWSIEPDSMWQLLPPMVPVPRIWIAASREELEIHGGGDAVGFRQKGGGLSFGADQKVGDWQVGAVAGYGEWHSSVNRALADAEIDGYQLGVYGGRQWDRINVKGYVGYRHSEASTDRPLGGSGAGQMLGADYVLDSLMMSAEAGYSIDTPVAMLRPFAGLSHMHVSLRDFHEREWFSDTAGIARAADATSATIGLHFSLPLPPEISDGGVHGTIGWRHAVGDSLAQNGQLAISSTPLSVDAAVFGIGMDLPLSERAWFDLSYDGAVGHGYARHSFTGRFTVSF